MIITVPSLSYSRKILVTAVLIVLAGTGLSAQNIDFGKSYINVTKGLNGGTVETGDVLEIRATFVVRSGTYDSCRYRDAVPAGTVYLPGTIRVLTNEGKIYKQFTDAWGDDAGYITGSNITINLGYRTGASPATAFRRGRVANTHKPSFYSNTCIMIASFQVRVSAATGTDISTGGGNMTYKSGLAAIQTFTFPANTLRVYTNYGICSNSFGANSIGTEFNGTFGSGLPRNRGISANVPVGYTYSHFDANMPNDYYYGIANNTSTRTGYTTNNGWGIPDASAPSHRVFSVWDIIGDHTGAVSPTAGNPPADTVANANAGYMLVINAAYRIDSAFQQTISGLCPNTYYEISCWMRNICSKCGCDSNGTGATNSSGPPFYIPTNPGDSSGVAPNLTFEIDGIDYYTSGNLRYTGQWVRKGFTFLTGPAQTSFTLKFFNNAPGGGGNDWALDDISVSTCAPNLKYAPSLNPTICDSNYITLSDTVRSFFNIYNYYKWQRSTDGGTTWTDVTPAIGPAVPYWNGTEWEHVATYNVPPWNTLLANSGDQYRVVVATTSANLTSAGCFFLDNGAITLNVIDCPPPLSVQLVQFNATGSGSHSELKWTVNREPEPVTYEIEKSTDGLTFTKIGTVYSEPVSQEQISYQFTDPQVLPGRVFYRLRMVNKLYQATLSRTVLINYETDTKSTFISVINPFRDELVFDIASPVTGALNIRLLDAAGRPVAVKETDIFRGVNHLRLGQTGHLANGVYFLQVKTPDTWLYRTVMKTN
ncbi:MAG: T9SS type A sorting domain-containing protein [Chitinophagales bacterium]|nr:T9SS type A sorting domain-containing protein [Chitinophagales bacterium]